MRTSFDEATSPVDKQYLDLPLVSIVMPCLNEAATLATCIRKARLFLRDYGYGGEVIVADNGSTDGSQAIAEREGARVVGVPQRGYGAALIAGIKAAKGKYVVMGDSDDSYDFYRIDGFIVELEKGADLVVGNRFEGGIGIGAMPWHHKYVGNPILSFFGRLFFSSSVRDFHCGMRAFRREPLLALDLSCPGMEFASEMIVRATLANLKIVEIPTTLKKDGRNRPPHLRSFRDGWRHLKFLLLHSPRWLFLYPGLALLVAGWITQILLSTVPVSIGNLHFGVHTQLYAGAASVLGLQLVLYGLLAHIAAHSNRLLPNQPQWVATLTGMSLEAIIAVGAAMFLGGVALAIGAVGAWAGTDFSNLDPQHVMRSAIPSIILMISGVELSFGSFLVQLMRYRK